MMNRTLQVQSVSKSFHGITILDHVSWNLEGGKVYGLNAPNGSGKSVLMKCMCGLMRPDSGKTDYNGKEVSAETIDQFCFGVSIEKPELLNDLSGLANVRYLASFRGIAKENEILKWFHFFSLYEDRNKKAGAYSLGMKQKLMLIQAFMEDPDVILLDEVTSSLDQKTKQLLAQVIAHERENGKILVMIDHDKDELHALCDEICTIEERRLVKCG